MIARDIMLSELCDTPIHFQHVSSCGSVQLLRDAKRRGIAVTGEVCPHHLWFTDEAVKSFDSNFKMNPPLRSDRDIAALCEGIADGTIDILASDHAPHATYEKEVEFDTAPSGVIGLETEFAAFHDLLVERRKIISLERLIAMLTVNPARLLNLDRGTLSPGAPGDVVFLDLAEEWTYDKEQSRSLARNTPFHGTTFRGRVKRTLVGGRTVFTGTEVRKTLLLTK